MGAIPVASKPPSVVDWRIIKQGQRGAYKITRDDGIDSVFMSFGALLRYFSRDDLTDLYRIVMKKYGTDCPEDEWDRVLWGDLRTMFEPPLSEDAVWGLPFQQKLLSWIYYDSCGVHCLQLESAYIYMLAERECPLSTITCKSMLEKKFSGGKRDEVCYQMLKQIKKKAGLK